MSEAYPLDADMLGNVIQDAVGDMNEGEPLTAKQWEYIGQRALEATAYTNMLEALHEAERQIVYLHCKFSATGSGAAVLGKIRSALALAEGRAQ